MESSKTRPREQNPGSPIKERGARARISARHKIVSLSLIIFALLVSHSPTTVLCNDDENILTIPALGRTAHLGYLYESKSDSFRPVSVFKQTVPDTFVTTVETPNTAVKMSIINSFLDKLRLLNVDPNTGASVLLGIIRAKGSSRFLTEEIGEKPNEVHGAIIYTTETLAQDLQIYAEGLKSLFTPELLQHRTASHILTGIVWGARISISLKCTRRDEGSSKREMEKSLMWTMEKITQPEDNLNLDIDSNQICNISIVAAADVSLPIQKLTPRTLKQVQQLLQIQLPDLIQNINGGKGVPLYYTLTPLSTFQKYFNLSPRTNVSFPVLSTENSLQEILEIFDVISATRQILMTLHETLKSHPSCVHSGILKNATDLQNNFNNYALNFKSGFEATLTVVRAGNLSTSSLADLVQDYRSNDMSVENVMQKLSQFSEFSNALQKIKFYTHLKKFYNDIEYCGKVEDEQTQQQENGLISRIFENRANSVYLFFTKTEFRQKDPSAYEEQLSTFYQVLYKPHNKLFFVDCDFEFSQCASINGTVIQKFENGQVTIHDVDREIKRPKNSVPLEVKAMGRFAKIGDLYDARTDRFVGQSILSPAQESALSLSVTSVLSRISFNNIPSETYEGKLNGLNIDPETQFSILGGFIQLAHSGLYLTQPKVQNAHMRSFALLRQVATETIQLSDSQFTESLATQVLNVTTATHFVSRIDYGFNSVFCIESHRPSSYNTFYGADSKLENFVQNLKNLLSHNNPGNNSKTAILQEWTENFKIKLFSDLQNTNPTTFGGENVDEFFEYFNQIGYLNSSRNYFHEIQQPIAYVLVPIESILGQVGIVQKVPLYSTVSSTGEDPLKFARILDTVNTAREQITELAEKLKLSPECTTDADLQTMKEIKAYFDVTLGTMKPQLQEILSKIKSGVNFEASGAEELERMRTEFESNNYFGDGFTYKELGQMGHFEEKLKLYKQTQGQSSNIQYLGRPNTDKISFSQIFTQSGTGVSADEIIMKVYLLFYKPSWTQEEGMAWQRSSQLFFGTLSSNNKSNTSNSNMAFYLVDCDFHQTQCANIQEPVIHEFTNGRLTSLNVTESVDQVEPSLQKQYRDIAGQIVLLEAELTHLRNTTTGNIEALNSEVDAIKTSTAGTNTRVSSIGSQLDNVTGLITENQNQIATVHTDLGGMERIVTTVQQQIDSLSSNVAKKHFLISEQQQNIMISLEAHIFNVSEAILENTKGIETLNSGLHTILQNVSSNENSILALSSRISVITATTTTTPRPTTTTTTTTTPRPTTTTKTTRKPTTTTTPRSTTTTKTTPLLPPTPVHPQLNLNCGGQIPMYGKGESKIIAYNYNQKYSNNERCLWSLNNEFNHTRNKQTLRIKLIRHGFAESVDWLYALKFNRDTGLVSQKIEMGQEYTFSEDQLYLSFTSDHSVTGNGFELQLTVIDSVETGRGWVKYSSSSSGVAEGGAYVDHDLFNIVINPKTSITFEVNFVHIENHSSCDYDRLLVWEIGQVGSTTQKARLCGDISTRSSSFTTSNPVIVLFTADGSNGGPSNAGFKVSWR